VCIFTKTEFDPKKKSFRAEKAASDEGQKQRLEYWEKVKEVKPENLIFIDETGIWEGMERSVSRSLKGRRAFSYRKKYKGQKHTVIGAISLNDLVCLKTIKASMKGEDFLGFVRDDLCPKLNADKVVVMDNLNTHKSAEVQKMITAAGAKILYLSSYSPDFNPIEMLWSVLKGFIRQFKPQYLEKMQAVIKVFFLLLDKSFFRNWFARCCYGTP
jgi:transposase